MGSHASSWEKLTPFDVRESEEFPMVSIVIPTYNSAQKIGITIESLLQQQYPSFEILVIDANSRDKTLEIVKSYRKDTIRLYSVAGFNRYEMLNKAISIAEGSYINFLFPGDFYIHPQTLTNIMDYALKHELPHLVYCGSLLREAARDVKILYRPLSLPLLRRGQQPTSLQSCWFSMKTFREVGKFNTSYQLRGGYELLCRFMLHKNLTHIGLKRVLTDYDLRGVTRQMVIRHFFETLRTVFKYFGTLATLVWLFRQKDVARYFHLFWRSFKLTAFGS